MGCCCKETLHKLVLLTASTLYLLVGLALTVGSAATFFTKWGKILTPLYAASSLGGGLVILAVSVVGFKAACGRKRCWLGTFMLFDMLVLILTCVSAAFMFEYEWVLNQAAKSNLESDVTAGLRDLDRMQTKVVKTLVDNAWDACTGSTTRVAGTAGFSFACSKDEFSFLGSNVNLCLAGGVNATAASTFDGCYRSPLWVQSPALVNPPSANSNLLAVLNEPKGLFCACSATIIQKFTPLFKYTKYVALGVAVFLLLIFISCCYLCCAARPDESDPQAGSNIGRGWSAGSVGGPVMVQSKGKRGASRQEAYIARP